MWNKRKDEEYTGRPASGPSFPHAAPDAELADGPPPPPSVAAARIPDLDPVRGGTAVIGKSVNIRGQIYSREDIIIDGEVEGTIEAQEHRITIGPNGRVRATVKAREILILGQLFGNVEAGDKAEVRRDAKLVGDVRTMRIAIEDGAWFKGSIDIVRPERKAGPSPNAVGLSTTAPNAASPSAQPLPPVVMTPATPPPPIDSAPAEVKR